MGDGGGGGGCSACGGRVGEGGLDLGEAKGDKDLPLLARGDGAEVDVELLPSVLQRVMEARVHGAD